ncbi:hypothetical protein [Brazilian marseillevirus]|uniref:hypothetical protein n=1 Tax=Brazilian marseillevirus TaxID=1813599 RepID=UPI0007867E77|nr:hypothetical protein A3303_gp065 [Brazilian marseillevirus]AMQ10573.1 hypothetical protein [Brazilian marseillevirus]
MEELPTELLVRIFEYSTVCPKDYASWSRVSRLFHGIAKNNCYGLLTKSLLLLSSREKELTRQRDEKTKELNEHKSLLLGRDITITKLRESLNKEMRNNTDLRRMLEESTERLKNQPDSSGYVRMGFNY